MLLLIFYASEGVLQRMYPCGLHCVPVVYDYVGAVEALAAFELKSSSKLLTFFDAQGEWLKWMQKLEKSTRPS